LGWSTKIDLSFKTPEDNDAEINGNREFPEGGKRKHDVWNLEYNEKIIKKEPTKILA
jgi:hypothetical protein